VEAIEEALKGSRFLLIAMSPEYFQSAWAQQEWLYALSNEIEGGGVRLIPLLYRDCEIPLMLRTKQWIDFRDQTGYQFVLERLVRDLRSLASSETVLTLPTETPKPGERVEELDPSSLSELRKALKEPVEAFRARPTFLRCSLARNPGCG
jgi:hypothetical protein